MSLTSYLAAPSRDLVGIRVWVRGIYSLSDDKVKHFSKKFFQQ